MLVSEAPGLEAKAVWFLKAYLQEVVENVGLLLQSCRGPFAFFIRTGILSFMNTSQVAGNIHLRNVNLHANLGVSLHVASQSFEVVSKVEIEVGLKANTIDWAAPCCELFDVVKDLVRFDLCKARH